MVTIIQINQSIKVNDIFLIEDNYYMLVGSKVGYALCSLSDDAYFCLLQYNGKRLSLSDAVSMIKEIMEDFPVTHYSQDLYNYNLKITAK